MKWRYAAATLVGIALIVFLAGYGVLRGSLPQLDGHVAGAVQSPVSIERDATGVVTITARNRVDLAYATGFAHGQDRFFQMDLQRRVAAGELAELLGASLVPTDKDFRRHAFRSVARQVVARATPEQKQLIDAYVAGVNDALKAMRARPFEYLLLRTKPTPWTAEDCVLVAFAMYIDLNDSHGANELQRARLRAMLPQSVFDLVYPRGTEWDAPLDGADLSKLPPPLPTPDVIDLRAQKSAALVAPLSEVEFPGSNNWALAKSRTADGAMVANDMHLSLRIPHIWYRARLVVRSDDVALARDLTGVTLPGLPLLVAGSNGSIAWGFTNTHGDLDDLVVVSTDTAHPNQYRDGDTYREFATRREVIKVNGGTDVEVNYRDTVWGPLLDEELDHQELALAWTAQRPEATNLNQLSLEGAHSVTQAIEIAHGTGIPPQNFMVADRDGHIGWTIIGKLPKRTGFDGRIPACWGCSANVGWVGWVAPQDYPQLLDPPNGQLWSANSRTLGGAGAELIGDEDMDRGARAKQIRDDLLALNRATPKDMLRIQLDDRALFLSRWRTVLLSLLYGAELDTHPARAAAFKAVNGWSEHAAVDDAGYWTVRTFRATVQQDIFDRLISAARVRYPNAQFRVPARFEDTAWRVMTMQPENLLDAKFKNWNELMLDLLDRSIAQLAKDCGVDPNEIGKCVWGRRNTLKMEHPLASSVPFFGRWLRMPQDQLPGDNDMPRVQGVSFGASERFAVSPGREREGYFHMPGGQSGHPLSRYFKAGHEAWVKGEPTPFLPGAPEHRLELTPR